MISRKEDAYGFTSSPRKSRKVGPVKMTVFDFMDNIVLVSGEVFKAQELLHSVELKCNKVGLRLHVVKTKVMTYNIDGNFAISSLEGSTL